MKCRMTTLLRSYIKYLKAIEKALDAVLPDLKKGIFITTPQDESKATYLGKRNPEDGIIDWKQSAKSIHQLIRATTKPLPGAYTYLGTKKVIVWKASMSEITNHLGRYRTNCHCG